MLTNHRRARPEFVAENRLYLFALTRPVFALGQALELYDAYHAKVVERDLRIEIVLRRLRDAAAKPAGRLPPARHRDKTANAPTFDARAALHAVLGVDLTQIHGLGPSLALKLIGECGTDLSAWPNAKHFTSWLCLAPAHKISGGKVLSTRTRRSGSRAAALLRLAAVTVGRTQTALGAFYRRLSARVGKAKAVTATARKIATLFYNVLLGERENGDCGGSRMGQVVEDREAGRRVRSTLDRRRIKPKSSSAGRSYRAGRAQSGYALYPRQGGAPTNTRDRGVQDVFERQTLLLPSLTITSISENGRLPTACDPHSQFADAMHSDFTL